MHGPKLMSESRKKSWFFSPEIISIHTEFGTKVLPGLFFGYALYAGGIWKGDVLVADLRSWRRWTHRKSARKDSMQMRWYFPTKKENLFFQSQMDELNLLEEIKTWDHPPLVRHRPVRWESHLDFLGESEGSLPQPHDSLPDAGEAINDFWSMSGNFIYRHHVEPRVKLYSPREEPFTIPLMFIDVSRTTLSNLDVKQEKRIDDDWIIDVSRDLSDPWTGFTQFTLLDEKAPDGYTWSGVRLTRKQLTSRPDHLWPELWKTMGKNAKLKDKKKWSNEKLHLEERTKIARDLFHWPGG